MTLWNRFNHVDVDVPNCMNVSFTCLTSRATVCDRSLYSINDTFNVLFRVIALNWIVSRVELFTRSFSITLGISSLIAASSSSSSVTSYLSLPGGLLGSLWSSSKLCEVPGLNEFLNPIFKCPTIFGGMSIITMITTMFGFIYARFA